MNLVNFMLSLRISGKYAEKIISDISLTNAQSLIKSYRYCLVILFVLLFSYSNATIYYVSSSGNDANSGTSPDLPWKTLAKVNSFTPTPGDQILFKRGDEWSGSITVKTSGTSGNPVVYGAYDVGEKPIIWGGREVTGWTLHSGNIYKATVNNLINQLFCNGERISISRHPNAGYISINAISNDRTFSSRDLSGTDWSGATAILRFVPWSFEGRKIVSSSGNSVTISSTTHYTYAMDVNDPFFVINSLATLDGPGQWAYDESSKTVYLWTPDGSSPANSKVVVSEMNNGFYGSGVKNITIQNLIIKGFQKDGVSFSGLCSNIVVDNCDLVDNYECGIQLYDNEATNNITITNNYISGSNRDGVRLTGANCNISDNVVENISLIENIGIDAFVDSWNAACGMLLYPISQSLVSYNKLNNIGYNGIMFRGPNNVIEYNRVNQSCLTLQDGGGIYSHAKAIGSVVRNNIISSNGPSWDENSFGIYLDDTSEGVTLKDNTVFETNGSGIFIHNTVSINVTGNTLFSNKGCEFLARHDREDLPMENNFITENTFFVKIANDARKTMKLWCEPGLKHGVSTSYNLHGCPETNSIYYIRPPEYWDYQTIELFQQVSGMGQGDKRAVVSNYKNSTLFYNDSKGDKTYNLTGGTYRDLDGNVVTKLTLKPFTSKILVSENSATPQNNSPVINNQIFEIEGDIQNNSFIGRVEASDPDKGQMLSYAIIGGNETGWFSINSLTGEITANENINVTNNTTVKLSVEVKDNAPNSLSATATVTINIKSSPKDTEDDTTDTGNDDTADSEGSTTAPEIDTTIPVISIFSIPNTYTSLAVPVINFIASDNESVTGYLITEQSYRPQANDSRWSSTVPTQYTFSTEGDKTLYAWTKDAAGNISNSFSATVRIILPKATSSFSEYLFEESGGTYVFDSQGSNTGSIKNEGKRVAGIKGNGLRLTGSGYVQLGKTFGKEVEDEVSVSAWIKPNSTRDDFQGIVMHGGSNLETFGLYILPGSSLIGFATAGTTSPWLTAAGINKLWDGNWHHLAATYDGTEKIIYLDGEVIAKASASGSIDSGEGYNLLIGAGRDYESPIYLYEGIIDEVRIYNYGLIPAEVEDLFNLTEIKSLTVYESEDISICQGSSYAGWTKTGHYERTLKTSLGADSIIATNLIVNPVYNITEAITITEGENYLGWTKPGKYVRVLPTISGCDSTITTNLTVKPNYYTQSVKLQKGWNIFSSYLNPVNPEIGDVVKTLRDNNWLIKVEDENGNTYERGSRLNSWINSIGNIEKTKGYKIQVNSNCTFEITGSAINLPLDIPLKRGWNIISFPINGSVNAMDIIQPLIDKNLLVKVQDESGNSIEKWHWFNSSRWYNRIHNFNSGKGYLVQVNADCVLQIKSSYKKSAIDVDVTGTEETDHFRVAYNGNGSGHMNINIVGLSELLFQAGDEIAAFDGDICVGAIKLNDNDMMNDAVGINASISDADMENGFIAGHSIELKAKSFQSGDEFQMLPENNIEGEMIFQPKSSVFILLQDQIIVNSDIKHSNFQIYPNPASEKVTVRFSKLPQEETRIILFDLTGKQLQSRIVSSIQETLDIKSYPSGIYMIKTIIGKNSSVKKLIKK